LDLVGGRLCFFASPNAVVPGLSQRWLVGPVVPIGTWSRVQAKYHPTTLELEVLGLATTVTNVQVESGKEYGTCAFALGAQPWVDVAWAVQGCPPPEFKHGLIVRTRHDDRSEDMPGFLSFTVSRPCELYAVIPDNLRNPFWLQSEGFVQTDLRVGLDCPWLQASAVVWRATMPVDGRVVCSAPGGIATSPFFVLVPIDRPSPQPIETIAAPPDSVFFSFTPSGTNAGSLGLYGNDVGDVALKNVDLLVEKFYGCRSQPPIKQGWNKEVNTNRLSFEDNDRIVLKDEGGLVPTVANALVQQGCTTWSVVVQNLQGRIWLGVTCSPPEVQKDREALEQNKSCWTYASDGTFCAAGVLTPNALPALGVDSVVDLVVDANAGILAITSRSNSKIHTATWVLPTGKEWQAISFLETPGDAVQLVGMAPVVSRFDPSKTNPHFRLVGCESAVQAQVGDGRNAVCRAQQGYKQGQVYFAFHILHANSAHAQYGVVTSAAEMEGDNNHFGRDPYGWSYNPVAQTCYNGAIAIEKYGPGLQADATAVIGVLLDCDRHQLEFFLNEKPLGVAFSNLPPDTEFFPAVGLGSSVDHAVSLQVGDGIQVSRLFAAMKQKQEDEVRKLSGKAWEKQSAGGGGSLVETQFRSNYYDPTVISDHFLVADGNMEVRARIGNSRNHMCSCVYRCPPRCYWEFKIENNACGYVQYGVATKDVPVEGGQYHFGQDQEGGWGYSPQDHKVFHGNVQRPWGGDLGVDSRDRLGCYLDLNKGELTFFKNGEMIGEGPAFTDVCGIVYPAVGLGCCSEHRVSVDFNCPWPAACGLPPTDEDGEDYGLNILSEIASGSGTRGLNAVELGAVQLLSSATTTRASTIFDANLDMPLVTFKAEEGAPAWFCVDLLHNKIVPGCYVLSAASTQADHFPRSWQLEAASYDNDASGAAPKLASLEWVVLSKRSDDTSLSQPGQAVTFDIRGERKEGDDSPRYNVFRFVMTGPDSGNSLDLQIGRFVLRGWPRVGSGILPPLSRAAARNLLPTGLLLSGEAKLTPQGLAIPYPNRASHSARLPARMAQDLNVGRGSFSIGCLVQTVQIGQNKRLITKRIAKDVPGASTNWYSLHLVDGKPKFDLSKVGAELQSAKVVNDGRWHHIVAVRDAAYSDKAGEEKKDEDLQTKLVIYVDGEETAAVVLGPPINLDNSGDFEVGCWGQEVSNGSNFSGHLRNVFFTKRVKT
jgi:hypothetical protein